MLLYTAKNGYIEALSNTTIYCMVFRIRQIHSRSKKEAEWYQSSVGMVCHRRVRYDSTIPNKLYKGTRMFVSMSFTAEPFT